MATVYFRTYIHDVQGRRPISTLTMMMHRGDGSFPQFRTRSVDFGHRPESRGDDQFPHFNRRSVDFGHRPKLRDDDPFPHFKRRSVDFGRRPNLGATTYFHISKGEVWILDVAPNWGRRPFSTLQKEKCGFCTCTFKVFLAIRVHFRTSKRELWIFE